MAFAVTPSQVPKDETSVEPSSPGFDRSLSPDVKNRDVSPELEERQVVNSSGEQKEEAIPDESP